MSNKNNIDKILNSSNELDEYEISDDSSREEPKQTPPRIVDDYEDVFAIDNSKHNISEIKVEEEDYGYLDDNDEEDEVPNVALQQIPNNQKITITRNIGKIFDVPNEAIIQTMKDNKVYKKSFSVKILGIGGAGNNIVKYVYNSRKWPDFVSIKALNTDYVALKNIPELEGSLYLIGKDELNGNGSGGDPEMGKRAASADADEIRQMLEGTDILIIVAGLGKGTGTGASPIIAEIAKDLGILTIGLFNLPSIGAEGNKTYSNALAGLEKLSYICSGFTAISNDKIIGMDRERTSIKKAYQDANEYIRIIIDEFINIITNAADVNIDFADIRNFFADQNGFLFLKVDVADCTKDAVKEAIVEKIDKGFTDIDILESKNAIFNFKINENVPSIILENARTAMKEIVKTNDLNIVNGISFSDKYENAEINILIAGKFDLGRISNADITDSFTSPTTNDDELDAKLGDFGLNSSSNEKDDVFSLIEEYNSNKTTVETSPADDWPVDDTNNKQPAEKKPFFKRLFKK